MKRRTTRKVKGVELESLLSTPGIKRDEEFSGDMPWPVYLLPNGQILFMTGARQGALWASRDAVLRMQAALNKPINVMEQYGFGHEFIGRVPFLCADACRLLKVPAILATNKEECLSKIDAAIRNARPSRVLSKKHFPCLVAYCGELLRAMLPGRWTVKLESDEGGPTSLIVLSYEESIPIASAAAHFDALNSKSLEGAQSPWIVLPNGMCIPIGQALYKEIYKYSTQSSVAELLKSWLR